MRPRLRAALCSLLLAVNASSWADGRGAMPRPMGLPGGMGPGGSAPNWPAPRPTASVPERPPPRETAPRDTPPPKDGREPAVGARDEAASRRDADLREPRESRESRDPRDGHATPPAAEARMQRAERMLTSQPLLFERDPAGAPVRRAEITMLLPALADLPPTLLDRGFAQVRATDVFGRRLVVLRVPADLPLAGALELGRRLVPEAEIDFNHVLLGSGTVLPATATPATFASSAGEAVRVGLIDEAFSMPGELAEVRPLGGACPAAQQPQGHGLAVATVLAREIREAGRRPVLHAADLGCGLGAVDAVASALQGMDAAGVPVVNVSAVGPHNRVLAAVVAAFLARGHVLVAAVGNDGPAAPALYPAAYPGVVAVTGVDRQGRVLLEAGRGEHVAFAAPGIVDVASSDGRTRTWRGTSFAAPVVSAALALRLGRPDVRAAAAAVSALAMTAWDAGEPGRDRTYGHGVVGLPATAVAGLR